MLDVDSLNAQPFADKATERGVRAIASVNLHPQYITDPEGERVSVVLPIDEYRELLEDLEDLAVVAERREQSSVSTAELEASLKADGIL